MQTFLERLKNAVFYYGTLVGEQWRALPMYISLGKEHNVDCLSTEVNSQSSMTVADPATSWGQYGAVLQPGQGAQRGLPQH